MKLNKFLVAMPMLFLSLLISGQTGNHAPVTHLNAIDGEGWQLMPLPLKMEPGEGKFKPGRHMYATLSAPDDSRVVEGFYRLVRALDERTCQFYEVHSDTAIDSRHPHFIISCTRTGILEPEEAEGYRLSVTDSMIRITAETDLGVLHAFSTLYQLLQSDKDGFYFPAVEIIDAPRFTWRGLMIDVARHFMPMDVIKRNLDAMALVKLNVLHLHLSDDQGFRVESHTLPLLHEKGSDGQYFTQEDIREIIRYAGARGIRVVPEFDMPAHTGAWFPGYPQLASSPGPFAIEREFGIFDYAFNPVSENTYEILEPFLTEMCALFPDPFFHIGGDECTGVHWDENRDIQSFKKRHNIPDNHALQAYFNKRIHDILEKNNKKMAGWEEIRDVELPKTILVQSWRGDSSLLDAVRSGYQVILSKGYYIDLLFSAQDHYLVDPVPDGELSEKEKDLILGGEATMWSEYVTTENIDSRIWPRTAAIAERFWSAARVRDVSSMYKRLDHISLLLENTGTTHLVYNDMMLRRLAGSFDYLPLKNLADVLEPLNEYQRWPDFRKERGFTLKSYSPYTRMMDVAGPDPDVPRLFGALVMEYLQQSGTRKQEEILHWLRLWKDNHDRLHPLLESNPALHEIESISADLASIAKIGLASMEYLADKKHPPASWTSASREMLEKARQPRGQTNLKVVDVIELLFEYSLDQTKME